MSLVSAASRHAVRPSSDVFWITDERLRDAFLRFTLFTSASTQKGQKLGHAECKRHGSSVPGPFEARRRSAKRRMNSATASVSGPPPETGLLFGMPNPLLTEPYLAPTWQWHPPGPVVHEAPPPLSLPAWLLPPRPPKSYHDQTRGAFKPVLRPSKRDGTLSNIEFQELLREVNNLAQLRDLQDDLSGATSDAVACSSLAFDHLLSLRQRNILHTSVSSSFKEAISVDDLISFVQGERLDRTNGANLAKLAAHATKLSASPAEQQKLVELVYASVKDDAILSPVAIAGLHRQLPQIQQLDVERTNDPDYSHLLQAQFVRRITQEHEKWAPTVSELEDLNNITKSLSLAKDRGASIAFILESIVHGVEVGTIDYHGLSVALDALHTTAVSVKEHLSTKALDSLILLWSKREEAALSPSARIRLVHPMLKFANLLKVHTSTIPLICDIIREHARQWSIASIDLSKPETRRIMANSIRSILSYDNLSSKARNPPRKSTLSKSTLFIGGKTVSYLTKLLRELPSLYAEQLITQTTQDLFRDSPKGRLQTMRIVNEWLDAINGMAVLDNGGKLTNPIWKSVLWEVARFARPREVPAAFRDTWAEETCEILIDNWIRRDIGDRMPPYTCWEIGGKPTRSGHAHTTVVTDRLTEIHARFNDVRFSTLRCNFLFWECENLHGIGFKSMHSKSYLSLLKALSQSDLLSINFYTELLELTSVRRNLSAFDAICHFGKTELGIQANNRRRRLLVEHIRKFGHTDPGRFLGIMRANGSRIYLSKVPNFLHTMISRHTSRVHPTKILDLLWMRDPMAQLAEGDPKRIKPDCSLSRERIDLVHESALTFATSPRFSASSAFQAVIQCIRYLGFHKAPLDSRISKACVEAVVMRRLKRPGQTAMPQPWLDFCITITRRLEGKDVADKVLRLAYNLDRFSTEVPTPTSSLASSAAAGSTPRIRNVIPRTASTIKPRPSKVPSN